MVARGSILFLSRCRAEFAQQGAAHRRVQALLLELVPGVRQAPALLLERVVALADVRQEGVQLSAEDGARFDPAVPAHRTGASLSYDGSNVKNRYATLFLLEK